MSDDNKSAEITTPVGSLKVSGRSLAELVAVFTLGGLMTLASLYWVHDQNTREAIDKLSTALEHSAQSQREAAVAQRETNCLLALTPEQRQQHHPGAGDSLCKVLARGQ
jgi:hypothetical protein